VTAEEWVAAFADAAGVEPPDPEQVEAILELAAIAAHSSERRAAPVACWVAAAAGLDPGKARELAGRFDQRPDTG
jgi:hypothetical protein